MKQVCLYCDRAAHGSNLFCQEIYCPAELATYVLEAGEWLGDLEVLRVVTVLRSAVLYEAQQNKRRVLLKVAHPEARHAERLKREAVLLRELVAPKGQQKGMPTLLPPYLNTSVAHDPYGKAMLRGQLLYFCLFTYVAGDSLRDLLRKNPQHWVYHAGWLLASLAATVALLQSKDLLHYALCPEAVLVQQIGPQATPQPLLIDLGIASNSKRLSSDWYPDLVLPGYVAPELLMDDAPRPSNRTDVYGLGIVFYELLLGAPAYRNRFAGDAALHSDVRIHGITALQRAHDVREAAALAVQAVHPLPAERLANAAAFTERLLAIFGEPCRSVKC